MELLYIWIEDYKNIHHQGFNFNPRYKFVFEPTVFASEISTKNKIITGGTLDDKYKDKKEEDFLPKDFFGYNISNVTAIVGKNGSGKSSLLEFIKKIYYVTEVKDFILIVQDKSKNYKLFASRNYKIEFNKQGFSKFYDI